jgi:two-component system, cell cycle response regulator
MRVLLAEDDPMIGASVRRGLAQDCFAVDWVEDGKAAQAALAERVHDALVLDLGLPRQAGLDVLTAMRRAGDTRPVLITTARDAIADRVAGLDAGADDYLVKPFDSEELKARLRTGRRILQLEDNLVEAREHMRFRATHDALTSLLNRGAILELLGHELSRTNREHGCTTVLLGDLDHFKTVNDTYGHPVGDEVLSEVARRLLGAVRSYDFVGRYGGEEFMVVLNNCGLDKAIERAEELRRAIGQTAVRTSQGFLPVTISVGALASEEWGPIAPDEVLKQVDAALYAAKAAGRNCSRLASPVTAEV